MRLNEYFKTFTFAENKKKTSVSLENVAEVFAESYGRFYGQSL